MAKPDDKARYKCKHEVLFTMSFEDGECKYTPVYPCPICNKPRSSK